MRSSVCGCTAVTTVTLNALRHHESVKHATRTMTSAGVTLLLLGGGCSSTQGQGESGPSPTAANSSSVPSISTSTVPAVTSSNAATSPSAAPGQSAQQTRSGSSLCSVLPTSLVSEVLGVAVVGQEPRETPSETVCFWRDTRGLGLQLLRYKDCQIPVVTQSVTKAPDLGANVYTFGTGRADFRTGNGCAANMLLVPPVPASEAAWRKAITTAYTALQ